jgi:hypothetical protein
MPQKNSFGLPALSVRFGSNDSGTPVNEAQLRRSEAPRNQIDNRHLG